MKAFFSSFRAKLILTIFPVVAGVTMAALLLTEWKFSAAYQRLFDEQFENQIENVRLARDRRAEAVSSILDRMATQPDIVAAMRSHDYAAAAARLRGPLEVLGTERLQSEVASLNRNARNELKNRLSRPSPSSPPQRQGPGMSPYVALVKPDGEIIGQKQHLGADAQSGPPTVSEDSSATMRRRSGKLAWLGNRKFEDVLQEQQAAYFILEGAEKRGEQVHEMFLTPFRDPADGKFLGALVFGLPVPGFADRLLYEQSKRSEYGEIMSGTYVEGKLISNTVPDEQKAAVADAVAHSLNHPDSRTRESIIKINGVRHKLLYRVLNPNSPFPRAAQVNVYSLAALDQDIASLRRGALGLGAVALLVALLLVLMISRSLSGPISKLVRATADISHGDYEVRVPVTRDEVGQLASAFNDMAAGLALQAKYRNVLHAVADRAVAERLMEDAAALGGEVREVAMLFCDIRGFTALTEKMPPQDVVELLNEHMTALTKVAYEHGGIVDKFVGDLIMVLFGAPVSNGDDALRAVRCAQEMMEVRRRLNSTSRHSLEIGIGIATGSVVAGCMGSGQRLNYTVLGHRVNLASRLCSIAQAGEIVTDDETVRPLNGQLQAEPLEPVKLKGFSQPINCYRITAESPTLAA